MEERASLKRSAPIPSLSECIICQGSKKDILFSATCTEQGLRSLKESSDERRKLRDTASTEKIDRILNATDSNQAGELHWHKSCYAQFTDKSKINRLRKSLESSSKLSPPALTANSALRSRTSPTDWKLCMFCQNEETPKKQALCSVTTFKMSQQILEGAKCEHSLSLRLASVNDQIAAEGKYHPNCYKKFLRSVSRSSNVAKDDSGTALLWLINELKQSAEQGHILELKEVWLCYSSLATAINIPPSFQGWMTTFKEHIAPHVADVYEFDFLCNEVISERQTVLEPIKFCHIPVAQLLISK